MNITTAALRRQFVCDVLIADLLCDPAPFYDAFEEGEDAMIAWLTALWETLCKKENAAMEEHPFFPEVTPYVLEDTSEGFCGLVTVDLPATPTASAVSAVIVFGSAMDPRVFAGVPTMLQNGETLELLECRQNGTKAVAVLHQGCDNGLQLFDPPTPQPVDKTKPLSPERRHAATVDAVVCYCMEND